MALSAEEMRKLKGERTQQKTKVSTSSTRLEKTIRDRMSERVINNAYDLVQDAYFMFVEQDEAYKASLAADDTLRAEFEVSINGLDVNEYTADVLEVFTAAKKGYDSHFMKTAKEEVEDLTGQLEEELEDIEKEGDLLMLPITIDAAEKIMAQIVAVGKRQKNYNDVSWEEVTNAIRKAGGRSKQVIRSARRRLAEHAAAPTINPPRSDAAPVTTASQETPVTTASTTSTTSASSAVPTSLPPLTTAAPASTGSSPLPLTTAAPASIGLSPLPTLTTVASTSIGSSPLYPFTTSTPSSAVWSSLNPHLSVQTSVGNSQQAWLTPAQQLRAQYQGGGTPSLGATSGYLPSQQYQHPGISAYSASSPWLADPIQALSIGMTGASLGTTHSPLIAMSPSLQSPHTSYQYGASNFPSPHLPPASSSIYPAGIGQHPRPPEVKVRRAELPIFSGERKDWPEWRNMWPRLAIPAFPDLLTLADQLRKSVKGDAEGMVNTVSITGPGSFDLMWNKLSLFYDDAQASVEAAMKRMHQRLQAVKDEDYRGFVTLVDEVEVAYTQMVNWEQLGSLSNRDVESIYADYCQLHCGCSGKRCFTTSSLKQISCTPSQASCIFLL